MGRLQHHHRSRSASSSSFARSSDTAATDTDARSLAAHAADAAVDCPFGHVHGLTRADLREAAYEVFFMSCRAAGGGRLNYFPAGESGADVSPTIGAGPRGGTGMNVVNSRVKRALGLKARRSSQPTTGRSSMNASSAPGSPGRAMRAMNPLSTPVSPGKGRRPMTSAEIMRQQMRVTEQSDARLRKTLMRTLVGQVGRKAETIILPLELLRQVKLTEFADSAEHHQWQRRQLKLLEAGLIMHPSLPHDHLNAVVLRFREVMQAADARAIDTGKTSDAMQALCNAVHALAWRSAPGIRPAGGEACHWADGYPLNVILYVSLLQAIFDLREETVVLDEVDELLELMRRTWPTLGINKMLHNVCFAWVLFQQYVVTGQIEPDLAGAALAMLTEVAVDAKQENRDPVYAQVLSNILATIHDWSEKRLLGYHEWFGNGNSGASAMAMEGALSLALATTQIISDNAIFTSINTAENEHEDCSVGSFAGDRVDYYVRCSMRSAFTKILENRLGQGDSLIIDRQDDDDPSDILARLAGDTEQIALSERDAFGPVLRRWHPFPGAAAAVTLHGCFGVVLKQYLGKATGLSHDLVHVLHAAGRLEKALVQMVVEDVADSDDGGKSVVREVVPYDVESVVFGFLRTWVEERLRICRECMLRAKETESWMPRSKNEPYAQSAVELMKLAKATVDEFFGIPVSAKDDMVQDLADGMEAIFLEYISFLTSCGSRQSYLPSLPPLTRCNQDSKIIRLWKKAATPCRAPVSSPRAHGHHQGQGGMASGGQNPRPSTSRGTQRLYVRLNTLHFILSHVHALDKSLSFFSRGRCSSPSSVATARLLAPSSHFDRARAAAQSAVGHVAEVAAYRLIFLDSHHSFYDGLYVGGVADARIRPALRTLKQNLSLLISVLVDRAQPVAVREVMKASFQAFLLVLLAGGGDRSFTKEDHGMVEEDFRSLKRAFCTRGEGLVTEEVVDGEAEAAESVVALMGQTAEQLVEELSIACELNGASSNGQRMPVPETTWRWSRTDPDTILRVLCHRDDEVASHYLKRAFQLPKRR
uniref:MHD1 domain-containing protein n=1 Tax=Oryza punctata TaxID=4537 RepID=A0A0E0K8K2_ORYPU